MTSFEPKRALAQSQHFHNGARDQGLVLLAIAVSGNQAFMTGPYFRQELSLLFCFSLVVLRLLSGPSKTFLRGDVVVLILSFLFISFWQAISLNYFAYLTIGGLLVKLVIAAGIVISVPRFRVVFISVMSMLAGLSLIIHIPTIAAYLVGINVFEQVGFIADLVGADPPGTNPKHNILIHNFMGPEHYLRNSGMFWEPGAFAGYLILALILLSTVSDEISASRIRLYRNICVAGVISTLSTTGYIALPLALLSIQISGRSIRNDPVGRGLIILSSSIILIPIGFYLWEIDFIGPKIAELYERAVKQEAGWELSRFGSIMFDWEYIRERPVFGWGQSLATQFSLHPKLAARMELGNGFTGFMRQMGLIGMAIFLVATARAFHKLGLKTENVVLTMIVLIALLNGEYYLTYPIFLALQFLHLDRLRPFIRERCNSAASRHSLNPIRPASH